MAFARACWWAYGHTREEDGEKNSRFVALNNSNWQATIINDSNLLKDGFLRKMDLLVLVCVLLCGSVVLVCTKRFAKIALVTVFVCT